MVNLTDTLSIQDCEDVSGAIELVVTNEREVFKFVYVNGKAEVTIRLTKDTARLLAKALEEYVKGEV